MGYILNSNYIETRSNGLSGKFDFTYETTILFFILFVLQHAQNACANNPVLCNYSVTSAKVIYRTSRTDAKCEYAYSVRRLFPPNK